MEKVGTKNFLFNLNVNDLNEQQWDNITVHSHKKNV